MLNQLKEQLQIKKGVKQRIQEELNAKETILKHLQSELYSCEKARAIMQLVAKETQEQLEYKISELVSLALSAIFDNPYELVLEYEIKRGKTEANILFKRGKNTIKPILSSGGGAVDVAAFGLRVAIWSLSQPKTRNTIVLDEPTKHLSKGKNEYSVKFGKLLSELSKKLGIQFIIVTHDEKITQYADKVFFNKMDWDTGIAKITEK